MMPAVVSAWLGLSLLGASVEVRIGDGLVECPLATTIPAAIERLEIDLDGDGVARRVPSDLVVAIDRVGDRQLAARLLDAGGRVLLVRRLPAGRPCPVLADAVALIVERYLEEIAWIAGGGRPLRRPVPLPPMAPTPAPPAPGPAIHLDLDAGALVTWDPGGAAAPGVLGGLAFAVGPVRTRLGFEVNAERQAAVQRKGVVVGDLYHTEVRAMLGAGLCGELGGRWCVEAAGGAEAVAATVRGDVFVKRSVTLWEPVLSAGGMFAYTITDPIALSLGVGTLIRPAPVALTVEGGEVAGGAELRLAVVEVTVSAGFSLRFF